MYLEKSEIKILKIKIIKQNVIATTVVVDCNTTDYEFNKKWQTKFTLNGFESWTKNSFLKTEKFYFSMQQANP